MARPSRLAVYQQLKDHVDELRERLGGLPSPDEAADIWQGIWFQEAHHSTAIEGNTLVLKQVEVLLAEGRAVGNKELAEYMEVRGYADAADYVYRQAHRVPVKGELLTLTELRSVHQLAMTPVWGVASHPNATDKEAPGAFRQHDIAPFPGGMTPPTWPLVHGEVTAWLKELKNIDSDNLEFPLQIARAHHRFEQIHPFLDGNGRAGRLLLNLVLVRNGFPPAVILKADRTTYLNQLRRADRGDFGGLGEFITRAILRSLFRFVIPAVAGPSRLVPLASLASKDMSVGTLRTAAVRGRLRAVKGDDGHWRSTKTWVQDYSKSRHKRSNS